MFVGIVVSELTGYFRGVEERTWASSNRRTALELCVCVMPAIVEFFPFYIGVSPGVVLVKDFVKEGTNVPMGTVDTFFELGAAGAFVGG